jgi:cystathionine beta-lyase
VQPHNPVGRVFDRDELTRIAELAERHDLVICSDEIHCGLVLDPATRTSPSPRWTTPSPAAPSP